MTPGMIGLTQINGPVGKGVEIGQWLNGNGFSRWEHAFVMLPGNRVLEAEPGGAVIRDLHYRYDDVHWCAGIWPLLRSSHGVEVLLQRHAEKLAGTPYSWLDYAALFTHRLRIPAPGLKAYIASSGSLICSQLADLLYQRLGAQIFDDKRWNGYVTPGALYRRDLQLRRQA